jgi:hypothetical protein
MPASEDAQRTEDPPAEERRRRTRPPARPGDWESLALSRVADRVEALTGTPDEAAPGLDATIEYGWEQRVLANLRRHLKPPGRG